VSGTCVNGDGNPINRDGVCFSCKIKTVRMGGLVRLQREREANVTQAELGREVIQAAKETGTEIARAR
jgi:hypothetical protein